MEGTMAPADGRETEASESDQQWEKWGEPFSWKKSWYPMAVVEDLDQGRPAKLELLGQDLVAWVDGEGQWRVFEDRCPHRNVPLSEGRVEQDGTLNCSYHGWRFNGEGRVTAIPQAKDADLARLLANPRACAATRPVKLRRGVLWVWGESSADAELESALVEPVLPEELDDPEMKDRVVSFEWQWGQRDLPYGWEMGLENVTDFAHTAVTHHKVFADRYTDPCPLELKWLRKATNKGGFKFRIDTVREVPKEREEGVVNTMEFVPPYYHRVTSTHPSGASVTLINCFIPTKPGRTRQVPAKMVVKGPNGEAPPSVILGYKLSDAPLPRWVRHVFQPFFVHQDNVFLHEQQAILQAEELKTGSTWRKSYWMPCEADKMTIMLRKWLDLNGGIDWVPGISRDLSSADNKDLLFDSYKGHTQHCTTCKAALAQVSDANRALEYAALLVTSAGISTSFVQHGFSESWPLLAGGSLLGLGAALTGKVKDLFYTVRYNHQDNE